MTPTQQPLDMMQIMQAIFGQQQQQQGFNPADLAALVNPQPRHLGMSGEDITNQKGPYDSGGIDWLKSHNDGTNGNVAILPQAQANTQSQMMQAFAPRAQQVTHMLPFTQELVNQQANPMGNPGFGNPAFGAYSNEMLKRQKALMGKRSIFGY